MKRLAIAVPTYNRSKDIEYFIEQESFALGYEDVDLLIYDSSENEDTEQVVGKYLDDGFRNLIYIKYPSKMPSNEKFFRIYMELGEQYDYIWMIHDHTVFLQEAFEFIYDKLLLDPDFVYLKIHTPPSVTECKVDEESDLNDFLFSSAWFLGKIGASIIKSRSFFKDIDWDYYTRKYLNSRRINFSHIGLYFERLSELDHPKVYTFMFPRELFEDTHKYETLAWDRDRIRIATQGWGEAISSLPDYYSNKEKVLTTPDRYIITKYILIDFREKGLYSLIVFLKYRKWIKKVFPEIYADAKRIAFMSAEKAKKIYIDPMISYIMDAHADGRSVFVYGAGIHAYECMKLLQQYDIVPEGFVVSSTSGNPSEIGSFPVISLEESVREKKKLCFVLAVMDIYKDDIIKGINKTNEAGADIEYCTY